MTFSLTGSIDSPMRSTDSPAPGDRFVVRRLAFFDAHHPAAGQFSLGLQKHGALGFQDLEGVRPELQPQNVALVGEEVVADVQPLHRLQMRPDDAVGDERADLGGVVASGFEIVQRLVSYREPLGLPAVPLGDARIEIPAVVVEARGVGDLPDLGEVLPLDLPEADDDVGDLNAEVVDVVLHFNRCVPEARTRDSVSPSAAFLRWPMCAALFGLIAVCSTIVFPSVATPPPAG